jgi:hypothetical protein
MDMEIFREMEAPEYVAERFDQPTAERLNKAKAGRSLTI